MREQLALLVAIDGVNLLRDRLDRRIATCDFDQRRPVEQAVGEGFDFFGERGREQQVLALRRQLGQHALDVVDETHVEHAVGFIEHENFELRQVDGLLLHVIEQASGRCHDDIHTAPQGIDLRIDADAAEHHRRFQLQIFTVTAHAFFHLGGEFARRREDQRADRPLGAGERSGCFGQTLQDRQRKACCLAVPVCAPASRSPPFSTAGMACN